MQSLYRAQARRPRARPRSRVACLSRWCSRSGSTTQRRRASSTTTWWPATPAPRSSACTTALTPPSASTLPSTASPPRSWPGLEPLPPPVHAGHRGEHCVRSQSTPSTTRPLCMFVRNAVTVLLTQRSYNTQLVLGCRVWPRRSMAEFKSKPPSTAGCRTR